MIHGATFTGNLFFDPLATNLAGGFGADNASGAAATLAPGPGPSSNSPWKRGVQTAEEHKSLRAASLLKVSRDLERMLRDLKR